MRNYLLAAVAAAAIATPAMARDKSGYIGIEGGAMIVEDMDFDARGTTGSFNDFLSVDHKVGYDVDAIAGYDFGAVRAEAEVAYKRAKHDGYTLNSTNPGANGQSSALSLMGNLLLDFGNDEGFSGFVGGGAGIARTRIRYSSATPVGNFRNSDSGFAYQAIAGVRHPISQNIDLGLKYRFFNAKVRDDVSGFNAATIGANSRLDSRFRSHSLLASLIFNFGAPLPPPAPVVIEAAPPPPPPPPATQTCPDGSVILATDVCPAPPPPPPPPEPTIERG